MKPIATLACAGLLASCGTIRAHLPWRPGPPPAEAKQAAAAASPAQPISSTPPSAPHAGRETRLGTTVANLGNPARPGLWLETPLVSAPRKGRIAVGGKTAAVDLLPLQAPKGTGSQMSLAAYRALGLPLTALPELAVYAQ